QPSQPLLIVNFTRRLRFEHLDRIVLAVMNTTRNRTRQDQRERLLGLSPIILVKTAPTAHEVVTLDVISAVSRSASLPVTSADSAVGSPSQPAPSLGTTWLGLAEELVQTDRILHLPVLV